MAEAAFAPSSTTISFKNAFGPTMSLIADVKPISQVNQVTLPLGTTKDYQRIPMKQCERCGRHRVCTRFM